MGFFVGLVIGFLVGVLVVLLILKNNPSIGTRLGL
jgi:hypothetical protein